MEILWAVLSFLGFIAYPAIILAVLILLFYYLRTPGMVAAYEKASFDRAHAYTDGKCCCGKQD